MLYYQIHYRKSEKTSNTTMAVMMAIPRQVIILPPREAEAQSPRLLRSRDTSTVRKNTIRIIMPSL